MFIIGLTGSFATGKSTVAKMFRRLGARVIDADKIAHQALKSGQASFNKIIKEFGSEILSRGRIDRKKLGQIVFRSEAKRKKLEAIVHPYVRKEINCLIKSYKKKGVRVLVLDIPLLFESGINNITNLNIVVKTTQSSQITRAKKEKKMNNQNIISRIRAQMPLRQKVRLADVIIDNGGSMADTQKQVHNVWKNLDLKKTIRGKVE